MTHYSGTTRCLLVALALAAMLIPGCGKQGSPNQPAATTTLEPFGSGVFSLGSPVKTYVHTFTTSGTFTYHCPVHGTSMSGTVHVDPAFADSPFVSIGSNFYNPVLVEVKTGSYVKWNATVSADHGVIRN